MIPVVTPEEMKAIDQAAPEPVEILIARAGAATARAAIQMLGGTYGRRVVVVAGKGNNGADGRDAATRLSRAGVCVRVVDASDPPDPLPACHLVIDAAYGTGSRGEYEAPAPGAAPVLAVDIPSGVNGLTGEAGEGAVVAERTITFAALKPGLLLAQGPEHAGTTTVAGIGLDVSGATMHLLETRDVMSWIPESPRDSHKWKTAVYIVAGSPGMTGAAELASRGALRAGAGTVRLGVPGTLVEPKSVEVVGRDLAKPNWAWTVSDDLGRCKAMVLGPGIGRDDDTGREVRELIGRCPLPMVLDADAIWALGDSDGAAALLKGRRAATVMTPHDGEFARLTGSPVPADRVAAVRHLAAATGATVLLKGSTTVVSAPEGEVYLTASGDARLATAGSGDVLSGVVGAFLAEGIEGPKAAAAAAQVHGVAGHLGWRRGLVAGDLPDLIPAVLNRGGDQVDNRSD